MSGSESGKEEGEEEEKKFFAEHARSGRAACKKCKLKIENGALRLGKSGYNPFGPGPSKQWHHVECMFEVFKRQRAATIRINNPDDIDGWSDLDDDDRADILQYLPGINADDYKSAKKDKPAGTPKKPKSKKGKGDDGGEKGDEGKEKKQKKGAGGSSSSSSTSAALSALAAKSVAGHKDNTFREFRRLCVQVAGESSYTGKTALVKQLFEKGTAGDGFKGDLRLWLMLLLPGAVKRVYNLQSKQLVKLFSRILHQDQDDMLEDLEQGDIAETISKFFQESKHCRPAKNSHLTIQEVDKFLEELSQLTREDDQSHLFTQVSERCTSNDLMYIIRLVKHDLRINAGPKHILEAIHPDAYLAFQTSRDLDSVLENVFSTGKKEEKGSPKSLNISVKLMTPVLPMLAEACKSIEQALKKCPNGMLSEIKYDGERVQVHKSGSEFKYFSRSLKPVLPHKIKEFKDYIPEAFPGGEDLILDSEILMVDTNTGQPLPFGTLGKHKKGEYKDACVCLFIFDCIYYNGKSLLHMPIRKRRKILHEHMTEIEHRIMFSETQEVHTGKDLENMMTKVFQMGLEGLVLKDLESTYEPGKRHWLKVKKDYLFGGAMADTADLVVLGAWFGTGQKGGMMSVFLMGCWDPARKQWCTVTKVHTGHDDKTLERLQNELQMEKISKEVHRVPSWLKCTKTMIPDFVAKDPKGMPVWEITGAEFTQHEVHTASGISIRFPRVTCIRSDKTWETATSLPELKELFKKSKDSSDFCLPSNFTTDEVCSESESLKKGHDVKTKTDDASSKQKVNKDHSPKRKSERSNSPKRKSTRDESPRQKSARDDSPKQKSSRDNSLKKQAIRDRSPERKVSRDDPPKRKSTKDNSLSEKSSRDSSPKHRSVKQLSYDDYDEDDGGYNDNNDNVDDNDDDSDNNTSGNEEISSRSNEKKSKHSEESKISHKKHQTLSYNDVEESESSNQEPSKKRKGSDSSGLDHPVKKIKLEDSPGSPTSNKGNDCTGTGLIQKQEDNYAFLFNSESFVKSLASEMQFIKNPALYHRVKGQLFELVHKAQQEQIKLDTNKCKCNCIHCYSHMNTEVQHSVDTVESTDDPIKNKVNTPASSDNGSNKLVITEENSFSESSAKEMNTDNIREKSELVTDNVLHDGKQTEKSETLLEENHEKELPKSCDSANIDSCKNDNLKNSSPTITEKCDVSSVDGTTTMVSVDSQKIETSNSNQKDTD